MLRKALITVVVVLVVLPISFLTFEHFRGRRRLAETIARLTAAGERLDISAIAPPPVAPASNGLDRLMAAVSRLGDTSRGRPPSMQGIAPGVAVTSSGLTFWDGGSRRSNDWATVIEWSESSGAALDEVRAALAMPHCQFAPVYAQGFHMLLPHLSTIKSATFALSGTAALAAREGDFEGALADLRAMGRSADALRREPIVISQLVRIAIVAITLQRAWDILHGGEWTDAQLVALQAGLPTNDLLEGMVAALEGERAVGLVGMRNLSASDANELFDAFSPRFGGNQPPGVTLPDNLEEAAQIAASMTTGLAQSIRRYVLFPLWQYAFGDQAIATYLEDMQAALETARHMVATHRLHPTESTTDAPATPGKPSGLSSWARNLISSATVPTLTNAISKGFVSLIQRSMLETDIALQRYQKRHGRFPDSLEALVPDFLPAVPRDAIDGRPLRYRPAPEGSRPLLWSVGENGSDEGGDPTPRSSDPTTNYYWWKARDAVWPRPATSAEVAEWQMREAKARTRFGGGQAVPGDSNRFVMSRELMRRYGLVPPDPAPSTNPPPASTNH